MKRRAIQLVVLLLLGAIVNVAVASTTSGDRQQLDVETLRQAAELYFHEYGHYPSTDSTGTWFEKLVELNIISSDGLKCGTTADGKLPVDLYGQLLVYEVLDPQSAGSAVFRSIGKDGVDNHGAGDDLDSRFGANFGYWNKSNWPQFYTFIFGGWLLAIVSGIVAWIIWRRALVALIALLTAGGLVVGVLLPIFFGSGFARSSATRTPRWGDSVTNWSALALLVGILLLAFQLWRMSGVQRRRFRRGLCPACAYPVGTSAVCTECGNQIPFPLRGRAREGVGRTETSNAHDDAERSTHPLAPSLKGGGKDPA